MTVFDILKALLHPIPPGDWSVTDPNGTGGAVTKSDVRLVAAGSPLHIEFDFTVGGSSHKLLGTVDPSGNATINLDGSDKAGHPVIHAGVSFKPFQGKPFHVVVHFSFEEGGARKDYRFEGKSAVQIT